MWPCAHHDRFAEDGGVEAHSLVEDVQAPLVRDVACARRTKSGARTNGRPSRRSRLATQQSRAEARAGGAGAIASPLRGAARACEGAAVRPSELLGRLQAEDVLPARMEERNRRLSG